MGKITKKRAEIPKMCEILHKMKDLADELVELDKEWGTYNTEELRDEIANMLYWAEAERDMKDDEYDASTKKSKDIKKFSPYTVGWCGEKFFDARQILTDCFLSVNTSTNHSFFDRILRDGYGIDGRTIIDALTTLSNECKSFENSIGLSTKKMKKSDNWQELSEKLYDSLEGFIDRGEFGSNYAMSIQRTSSGGVELDVWRIGGHDIELKFEIFVTKDDFADAFYHEESGFIVNIYRTINGNESRYVSNERVEGGFRGLASYIRQYVDDMHTYGDPHVPNTYDGNTSVYDMPEEYYASTKKMQKSQIAKDLSYGECVAIEEEWNKFKQEHGGDGSPSMAQQFVNEECSEIYNEEECNEIFDYIGCLEEDESNKSTKKSKIGKSMPNVGDAIMTPRFMTVHIKEVFDSYDDMVRAGYKEPTHYRGDFWVNGKSIDEYHMHFACSPNPDWYRASTKKSKVILFKDNVDSIRKSTYKKIGKV